MPDVTPIAVNAGFGWSAGFSAASFLALLGILIKQLGPWRKIKVGADEKLREDLLRRVESLEGQLAAQAAKYERQIADQGAVFLSKLENEREDNENSAMIMRHRLNNITACFDSFLMLVKANPERAAEAVTLVEEMRAKQIIAEATEKATLRGTKTALLGKDAELEA